MATLDTKLTVVEAYQSARKAEPDADVKRLRTLAEWVGNKFSVPWHDVTRWSVEFDNDTLEADPEKPVSETTPALTDDVRLDVAERYSKLLLAEPEAVARELAATIALPLGVAPDAVQDWARKYGTFRRPCSRDDRNNPDVLPDGSAQIAVDSVGESTMMPVLMNPESTILASEVRSSASHSGNLQTAVETRERPAAPLGRISRLSGGLPVSGGQTHDQDSNEETPTDEAAQLAAADAAIDAEFGDDTDEDGVEGGLDQDGIDAHPEQTARRSSHRANRKRAGSSRRSRSDRGVSTWRTTKSRRRAGTKPDAERGCVTAMMSAPAKNAAHAPGKPRLAASSRTITLEEFADVLDFGRTVIDNFKSEVETFDAGMLGSFIVNNGTPIECAEALLAIVPIARRVTDRLLEGGAN